MSDQPHYAMIIDWSDEDDAYIVTVPDLPGARTHGASYEEAARKGQEAIELWLEVAREGGETPPAPKHAGIGERFNPLNWPDQHAAGLPEAVG